MKLRKQEEHARFVTIAIIKLNDMTHNRRRWNIIGFIATPIAILLMLGLIICGHEYKEQMESVLKILIVVLIVAIFAIISRNVKILCKKNINSNTKEK